MISGTKRVAEPRQENESCFVLGPPTGDLITNGLIEFCHFPAQFGQLSQPACPWTYQAGDGFALHLRSLFKTDITRMRRENSSESPWTVTASCPAVLEPTIMPVARAIASAGSVAPGMSFILRVLTDTVENDFLA